MSNPFFEMLNGGTMPEPFGTIQKFNEFKSSFHGNPQEEVQHLLNSGRITQEQYNDAVQKANYLRSLLTR